MTYNIKLRQKEIRKILKESYRNIVIHPEEVLTFPYYNDSSTELKVFIRNEIKQHNKLIKKNKATIENYKIGTEFNCSANEFNVIDNHIIYADIAILDSQRIKGVSINILNNITEKFTIHLEANQKFHFVPYSDLTRFLECIEKSKRDIQLNPLLYMSTERLEAKYNKALKDINKYIYYSYIFTQEGNNCTIYDDYINVPLDGLNYIKIKRNNQLFFIDELEHLKKTNKLLDQLKTELSNKIETRLNEIITTLKQNLNIQLSTNLSKHNTSILLKSKKFHNIKMSLDGNGLSWYYNEIEKFDLDHQFVNFSNYNEEFLIKEGYKYIHGDFVIFHPQTIKECIQIIADVNNPELNKNLINNISRDNIERISNSVLREYNFLTEPIKMITDSRYKEYHVHPTFYNTYDELFISNENSNYNSDDLYTNHKTYQIYFLLKKDRITIYSKKPQTASYILCISKGKIEIALFFLMRYFASNIENKRELLTSISKNLLEKFGIISFNKA